MISVVRGTGEIKIPFVMILWKNYKIFIEHMYILLS